MKTPHEADITVYAERYRIEYFFNQLKRYCTVTNHYAARARNSASLIYLAASML